MCKIRLKNCKFPQKTGQNPGVPDALLDAHKLFTLFQIFFFKVVLTFLSFTCRVGLNSVRDSSNLNQKCPKL